MRTLLFIPAFVAVLTGSALAQTTRPALAQLDAEVRALYGQVAAGTVRVQLPALTVARLMTPDGHPIPNWSEVVDAAVWERLTSFRQRPDDARDGMRPRWCVPSRQVVRRRRGSERWCRLRASRAGRFRRHRLDEPATSRSRYVSTRKPGIARA